MFTFDCRDVELILQIEPELRVIAEVSAKAHRGIRRYRRSPP